MRRRRRLAGAGLLLAAAALGGCTPWRASKAGPEVSPAEAFAGVLGRNPGVSTLRAEVEARFRYAGARVSLPGVLVLDSLGGFRLELLDPMDRPLAIFFPEGGRIDQYRPAERLAASLALFPQGCRLGAGDWVTTVLSSSSGPTPGERLAVRPLFWGGERVLERTRDGELRQSVRFAREGAELVPRLASWYCGDDVAVQLRMRDWVTTPGWRLPARFDLEYPAAGLQVSVELRNPEANPPGPSRELRPQIGGEVRWTTWRLPR